MSRDTTLRKKIPSWVKILAALIGAALVLLAAGYLIDRGEKGRDAVFSAYSTEDEGMKGLFLSAEKYLGESGIKTRHFAKGARFIPENSLVLLVGQISPIFYSPPDSFEAADIGSYLRGGGVIMVACDLTGGLSGDMFAESAGTILSMYGFLPEDCGEPEISSEYGLVTATYGVGEGMLLAVNCPGITNGDLKESAEAGARLLMKVRVTCARRGIDSVLFDDYYFGVDESSRVDVLGYGIVLAAVELLLSVIVYLIAAGDRFGAPEAVPELERRSETEPVEALAGMYVRAGGGANIFRVHMEALCSDLRKHLALPGRAGAEEILDEVRRAPGSGMRSAERLLNVYIATGSGADGKDFDRKTLNGYIREIDAVREELR